MFAGVYSAVLVSDWPFYSHAKPNPVFYYAAGLQLVYKPMKLNV